MKTIIIVLLIIILAVVVVSPKEVTTVTENISNNTHEKNEIVKYPSYVQNSSGQYIQNIVFEDTGVWIKGESLTIVTIANTTSMLPTIQPSQTVLISNNVSNVKVGDIIIYSYSSEPTVNYIHRVVQINSTNFTAKGDNNERDDGVYPIEAIRDVVYAVLY